MARTCTICTHPRRDEIDEAILSGTSYRDIAEHFGTSKTAVWRHADAGHIADKLVKAKGEKEILAADNLLMEMENLHQRTLTFLDEVEADRDRRSFIAAIKEVRSNIELLMKISTDLAEREGVGSFRDNPEWAEMRVVFINVLQGFPGALEAIVEALNESEA